MLRRSSCRPGACLTCPPPEPAGRRSLPAGPSFPFGERGLNKENAHRRIYSAAQICILSRRQESRSCRLASGASRGTQLCVLAHERDAISLDFFSPLVNHDSTTENLSLFWGFHPDLAQNNRILLLRHRTPFLLSPIREGNSHGESIIHP